MERKQKPKKSSSSETRNWIDRLFNTRLSERTKEVLVLIALAICIFLMAWVSQGIF